MPSTPMSVTLILIACSFGLACTTWLQYIRMQYQMEDEFAASAFALVGKDRDTTFLGVEGEPQPLSENDWRTWPSPTPSLLLDASLDARLRAWEATPISNPEAWLAYNWHVCPESWVQRSVFRPVYEDQKKDNGYWAQLWRQPDRIADLRSDLLAHMREIDRQGLLDSEYHGNGYGMVMAAGDEPTLKRLIVSLKLLRQLGSSLDVEVFRFANEIPDPRLVEEIVQLGATMRVVEGMLRDNSEHGYNLKAAIIIQSSFQHVFYLDSDNMLLVAPDASEEGIFWSKGYQRLGAMFWPDYWHHSALNPIWQIIGVQCRAEWQMEAGQILINKAIHLDTLHLADYMMRHPDVYFHLSFGDKDLFKAAFLALRKRWAVPGRHAADTSFGPERQPNGHSGWCGHSMLQHDHMGKPMTVHLSLLKLATMHLTQDNLIWGQSVASPAGYGVDGDTDCDQLANAVENGRAIADAPHAVRLRAAHERGLKHTFNAGQGLPACIATRWEDTRDADARFLQHWNELVRNKASPPAEESFGDSVGHLETKLWSNADQYGERLIGFDEKFWIAGGQIGQ